ncbi:DUF7695 domain-containing protein [Paenibacillus planticolens]|uniref:DUF7695 domain-containing protein n=1 Tax=Paenibacillus planticolens TaxID=2654976 RepID=A0ABX1ZFI5_9BACL|nr:hypothetical protein [Paenibacillus planticolens]NOU98422.1 hypothetical protein [Paenibacillus planticolens]
MTRNAIRCLACNDVIESRSQHDFNWCSCGSVAVDGGLMYGKRMFPSGQPSEWYADLSEYEEAQYDAK